MFEKIKELEFSLVEDVFERFCNFTDKWVGLDCFFWSKVMMTVSGYTLIQIFMTPSINVIAPISFFISLFGTLSRAQTVETHHKTNEGDGMRNSELIHGCSRRFLSISLFIIGLVLTPLYIYRDRPLIMFCIFWGSQYCTHAFLACTPLPPKQSKLKRGLSKFRKTIKLLLPGGLPSPA